MNTHHYGPGNSADRSSQRDLLRTWLSLVGVWGIFLVLTILVFVKVNNYTGSGYTPGAVIPTAVMPPDSAPNTGAQQPSSTPIVIVLSATPSMPNDTPHQAGNTPTPIMPSNTPAPPDAAPAAVTCQPAFPSRLQGSQAGRIAVGVTVLYYDTPGSTNTTTVYQDMQFDIISGPQCQNVSGEDQYWWQVRMSTGEAGWLVESTNNNYYIEPIPGS